MMLSKTQIVLIRCWALGLGMALPACMAAQLLDRGNPEKPVSKTHKEWALTGIGEMKAHDSTDLGFVTYTNQAGVAVTIIRGTLDSDKHAVSELNYEIKNAKKVMEHSLRKDESGKIVGERIVVVFQETSPQADLYAVVWTDGRNFCEVLSPLLSLVLEREKELSQALRGLNSPRFQNDIRSIDLSPPGGDLEYRTRCWISFSKKRQS